MTPFRRNRGAHRVTALCAAANQLADCRSRQSCCRAAPWRAQHTFWKTRYAEIIESTRLKALHIAFTMHGGTAIRTDPGSHGVDLPKLQLARKLSPAPATGAAVRIQPLSFRNRIPDSVVPISLLLQNLKPVRQLCRWSTQPCSTQIRNGASAAADSTGCLYIPPFTAHS